MKLLFVIGSLDSGGAEHHLVQLIPQLTSQGITCRVYTLTHTGVLAKNLQERGITVIQPFFSTFIRKCLGKLSTPFLGVLSVISYLITLSIYRPNIIHYFLPAAYLFASPLSFFSFKSKKIMSRRSLNHYQKKYPHISKLEHWLHKQMDYLLANSLAVAQELIDEGSPPNRVGLIYNGVNSNQISVPSTHERLASREKLSIPRESLCLIIVANLIPYKGHIDLLNALADCTLPDEWVLLVVGRDNGILMNLQSLSHDLGISNNIRWMGSLTDLTDIYRSADIAVLPSHEEGFSNAILEAMAYSLPVVATDVGGNAEAIADGNGGIIVSSRNPHELSRAISKLANNPELREKYGHFARCRVENEFNWEKCTLMYSDLYAHITTTTNQLSPMCRLTSKRPNMK